MSDKLGASDNEGLLAGWEAAGAHANLLGLLGRPAHMHSHRVRALSKIRSTARTVLDGPCPGFCLVSSTE